MYRCTECHAEYEEYPDFCDCGNDEFEEVSEDTEEEKYEYGKIREIDYEERDLTPDEIEILEEQKKEKKKSVAAIGVIACLCVLVFILPPHGQKKIEHVKKDTVPKNIVIPSVDTYWDDSLPDVPLLNERLSALSTDLRDYLVSVGRQFNTKWDTSLVTGAGECMVEIRINNQGGLNLKTIISSSGNRNLDDSVSMLLTNTYGFRVPPNDYNGEKIYISFSLDKNGISKVSYPSYSKKNKAKI